MARIEIRDAEFAQFHPLSALNMNGSPKSQNAISGNSPSSYLTKSFDRDSNSTMNNQR